jgi:hypothetical protein
MERAARFRQVACVPVVEFQRRGTTHRCGCVFRRQFGPGCRGAFGERGGDGHDDPVRAVRGTVNKVLKSAGTPIILALATTPIAIAVDATNIFWSDQSGNIFRINK